MPFTETDLIQDDDELKGNVRFTETDWPINFPDIFNLPPDATFLQLVEQFQSDPKDPRWKTALGGLSHWAYETYRKKGAAAQIQSELIIELVYFCRTNELTIFQDTSIKAIPQALIEMYNTNKRDFTFITWIQNVADISHYSQAANTYKTP